jgi:hypothetical protein
VSPPAGHTRAGHSTAEQQLDAAWYIPLQGLLAQQERRVAKIQTAFRHFIGPSMPGLTKFFSETLASYVRLFTGVRGRGILRSSFAGSCIAPLL